MASSDLRQGRIIIDKNEDGSRLDRALIRLLGTEQRPLIMRLIRKGNVRINGKRSKPESRLCAGDEIFLPASLRSGSEQATEESIALGLLQRATALPVLYEDEWLLAVEKPAGMVVHGGSGHGAGLIEALKEARSLPELRLAHRLDRDTSGVLLMAKHLDALRRLTEGFRERDMQKTYFALITGHPFAQAGRMRSRLAKGVVRGGERMVVDSDVGKEAVTDYQVMLQRQSDGFDWAMVALHPHSGRTHQLRVQLQAEGHAILGDPKYAGREELAIFKAMGGRGLMLHAWRLRFAHPVTGLTLDLRAGLPQSWLKVLQAKKTGRR